MPRSRKRKKQTAKLKSKKPKPYEAVKLKLFKVGNLFREDVTIEKRLEIFLEIGKKAAAAYEEEYLELMKYFAEYDALYLLSFCIFYFVAHQEGIDEEAIEGKLDFPPFFIEVLQAFSLFIGRTISAKPLAEKALEFKKLLQEFNKNQSYKYYTLIDSTDKVDDMHKVYLRMNMMINTLAVRNWAYEPQMQEITYSLFETIKNKFEVTFGFSPKFLLDIFFGLVELTNEKINVHLRKIRSFALLKNYNSIFDRYEEEFPNVNKTNQVARQEIWKNCNNNLDGLRAMLLMHSDIALSNVFTFQLSDFQKLSDNNIPVKKLIEIFEEMSYDFGDLKESNKDHIFLNNPVHSKPFIRLQNEGYFSSITFLFSHLSLELLETFVARNSNLRADYLKAKAKFLEDRIETLFTNAFPTAIILRGSIWRSLETNKDYENDLLVLIENFAIIIEAKSGTITAPAKRGATDRLFETLKELIVRPSEQAIRFLKFLQVNPKIHEFKTKSNIVNTVDSSKIKYFIPLGVTLSTLGTIGCNLKKLIDAGITNLSLDDLAPSISITDLETIFRLLPLQAQKIHYLSRRREFEAHVLFEGDEIDLFAFYLDNMFNIGDAEYNQATSFNFTLKSKEIDPYILGTSKGIKVAKPKAKMTKFWFDLLNSLVDRKSKMWLDVSFMLLNAPEEDQRKFESEFNRLKKLINKKRAKQKPNWMTLYCGPERRRYAIVGYPYKDITRELRNDIINNIIQQEKDDSLRGILIIGQDIGKSSYYPYSIIAGSRETKFLDKMEIE